MPEAASRAFKIVRAASTAVRDNEGVAVARGPEAIRLVVARTDAVCVSK
jgi:hypothetical protein